MNRLSLFLLTLIFFNLPLEAEIVRPPVESKIAPPAKVRKAGKTGKRSSDNPTVPVPFYTLLSKASGNCVAISMASKKEEAVAIEWRSSLGHEQQWQMVPVDGHWIQLIARHSDRALMVRGTSENPVIQGNRNKEEATHWKLSSDEDGYIRLQNRQTKNYLSIAEPRGSHGDGLVIGKKADSDRQKWGLTRISHR